MTFNAFTHDITIQPTVKSDGTRCWYAGVALSEAGGIAYDGDGATIELALCDLIDQMAGVLKEHEDESK
jgi:hypothetical protein